MEGKKIRNSFKIEKEGKGIEINVTKKLSGREISLSDSLVLKDIDPTILNELNKISFTGYDKEVNSPLESFIVINYGNVDLTGFKVKIDYLDMKGRRLHSRTLHEECFVPAGESRHIDVKSWDRQLIYYYYLGNEPKKVATPFQVVFTPLAFSIDYMKE